MSEGQTQDSPFARLLELQGVDAHIDRLGYQIEHHPARVAVNELHGRHLKLNERAMPLRVRVVEFDHNQSELEREAAEADSRIKTIQQRLLSGFAGSFRDEGAMSSEIESLMRRKSELEDRELELMEEREPFDLELEALRHEDDAIEEEARTRQRELDAAKSELSGEIEQLQAERSELASTIEPALLRDYQQLRSHLGGIGVARLEHGNCSGCNLALSAGERDRITHAAPDALFHCEQCGRILVP